MSGAWRFAFWEYAPTFTRWHPLSFQHTIGAAMTVVVFDRAYRGRLVAATVRDDGLAVWLVVECGEDQT